MGMNVLLNRIDAAKIFQTQSVQNQEALYLADTVPAATQKQARVSVSSLGHFFCQHITMSYTTVDTVAAAAADTGIDYLRGKLMDAGAGMLAFMNDYVPFHLIATPGRRMSIAGSGNASAQMHVIFPFEYMFKVNSDIIFDVKNDAVGQPNSYSVVFWGIRVKTSSTTGNM